MELTSEEIRVLGCLVEKEATTPDAYPLSTNGLMLACNQRSSREPIVDYDEDTVRATMLSLRERGFARTLRGQGNRVYKHAHALGEALQLEAGELALLSVLMLRGAQTAGELRSRTERQYTFSSVDEVEAVLGRLAERDPPLVVLLPRRPGQREARWGQLLGSGEPSEVAEPARVVGSSAPGGHAEGLAAELAALRRDFAELRARLDALETRLAGAARKTE